MDEFRREESGSQRFGFWTELQSLSLGDADKPFVTDTPTILIGGGGHAKVVLDAAQCAGVEILGFFDDDSDAPISRMPSCPQYLGGFKQLGSFSNATIMLAIGDLSLRSNLIDQLGQVEFSTPIIHPSAIIAKNATISDGVFVGPGAVVNTDATISAHAIINTGSIIEHDCQIGMNSHIAPRVVLGGGVRIGNHTLIGIGSTVLPGVCIGTKCVVGAGSVVTQSIVDNETVVGVPARSIRVGVL
ncbi:MAG: acetyltransferase [Phycisphaerales bacterium]|nr:acetyltransferase [Phycisphaerales bacterium]